MPVPTPPVRPGARPDGSMSLLVDMMTDTLDSDYREATEARTAGPRPVAPVGRLSRRRGVVPLLVVLGLLTGTAAAQVRSQAHEVDDGRRALATEVGRRTAQSDRLDAEAEALRAQLAREQAAALGASTAGQRAASALSALELVSGTVAVRGEGLVVRLDDAPDADAVAQQRGGRTGEGRVLDRDLQDAVNGLWAAGAEAVSVNDQRLSALTAIRSAGEAVLVDHRPLTPPYVLRALGPSAGLERRFTKGETGRRLATYPGLYGIDVRTNRADALRLPAAGVPDLRAVRPA